VEQLLRDLRSVDCDVVTIGQYLRPTRGNLPVVEYVSPERFAHYRDCGLALGFRAAFSGPLVRSSYMADAVWNGTQMNADKRR
jgi:lipoic acid synthetase